MNEPMNEHRFMKQTMFDLQPLRFLLLIFVWLLCVNNFQLKVVHAFTTAAIPTNTKTKTSGSSRISLVVGGRDVRYTGTINHKLNHKASSWDDIEVDIVKEEQEEEDDDVESSNSAKTPTWKGPAAAAAAVMPKDMKYNEYNLMRQNKHFIAIRAAGGSEMTNDIYARDPDTDVFWFVGKVARISDVSLEKAVARQYPLIEEHSARLRPLELFDKNGLLELWSAPGDSELDVAYNRPHVIFVKMPRAHELEEGGAEGSVRNVEVGFQGEIYESGEEGFRTQRKQDGSPLKPEIQQS
mmetsp:Transcript_12720/g.23845  ORF Transcript_12720/g.23845 Transcript_12720/m.23845 type:complete len:296 (+) Transcript_12720:50-937(+)